MLTSWFWILASHSSILRRSFRQVSSKVKFLFWIPPSCWLASAMYSNVIWLHSANTDSGRAFAFKPDEPDLYLVGTGVNKKMFFFPLSSCIWFKLCTSAYTLYGYHWLWLYVDGLELFPFNSTSDEGVVYLCTTQYASTYINTFKAIYSNLQIQALNHNDRVDHF